MAKRLANFPGTPAKGRRSYPWHEWTDGSVWEIRRGEDYDVRNKEMITMLHVRAAMLDGKVRTHTITDELGEGLAFQFLESDKTEGQMLQDTNHDQQLIDQLYRDLLEIYEGARAGVTIERKDGKRQKYAPTRFKQQIDKGYADGALPACTARMLRKRTLGFGHLEAAGRTDLMVETLVLDSSRPYHKLFSPQTVQRARERMAAYHARRR